MRSALDITEGKNWTLDELRVKGNKHCEFDVLGAWIEQIGAVYSTALLYCSGENILK